jgi:phosphohistidine phosphatase
LLVLVRHGKAEQYGDDDHRRQLTERGRRQARAAGEWLAAHGYVPTHAIVSSATRTRETWDMLRAGSGTTADPDVSDAAYPADAEAALAILRGAPSDAAVLAFVGHNPTASSLVHLLDSGEPDPVAFRALSFGLPTSGVAVLEVPVPWADLDVGSARLVAGHTP